MNGRRVGLGALGGGTAVLCAASVAWACTYQPRIFGLTTDSGRPSSTVTVSGQAVNGQGTVELHWNSATGQLLAAATPDASGNYSVPVTIPADATPSVYYIVAVSGGNGIARSAFEVTSPAPATSTGPATATTAQPDSWSTGFTQGQHTGYQPASVVDAADQSGLPAGVALGLGLGAAGAAVLGGLGIAAARRRRSEAHL